MVISGVLCRRRLSVYILKSQTFIFYYFFHFVVPSVVTYRQFILYTISNAVLLWLCLAFLCSQSAQADQVVHSFISFFAQVTFAIRWGFLSFGSIYSSYSAWSWAAKINLSPSLIYLFLTSAWFCCLPFLQCLLVLSMERFAIFSSWYSFDLFYKPTLLFCITVLLFIG